MNFGDNFDVTSTQNEDFPKKLILVTPLMSPQPKNRILVTPWLSSLPKDEFWCHLHPKTNFGVTLDVPSTQSRISATPGTHRDALEGRGVEGAVNLVGDVLVVVVEVFQPQTLLDQLLGGLVERQGQGPDGVVGQRRLLEAAGLLRVLAQPLLELLDELLGRLGDNGQR